MTTTWGPGLGAEIGYRQEQVRQELATGTGRAARGSFAGLARRAGSTVRVAARRAAGVAPAAVPAPAGSRAGYSPCA